MLREPFYIQLTTFGKFSAIISLNAAFALLPLRFFCHSISYILALFAVFHVSYAFLLTSRLSVRQSGYFLPT